MHPFELFRLPIVGAYRQPETPSPQQKTLYATQHKGFYCINSSRYINAPIICTSKILNTVIDGKIIA